MNPELETVEAIAGILHQYVDRYPYVANLPEGDAVVRQVGVIVEIAERGQELTVVVGERGESATVGLFDPPSKRGTPEEILERTIGLCPTEPPLTDEQQEASASFGLLAKRLAALLGRPLAERSGSNIPWKVAAHSRLGMPLALVWFGTMADGKIVPDMSQTRGYELTALEFAKLMA